MSPDLSRAAVLSIEKGEEIFGGWTTVPIPQVGIYKLLAKKKADGTIEWTHFVQSDDGMKDRVMRGETKTHEEFMVVKDTINSTLCRIYGVTLKAADYNFKKPGGKNVSGTKH